jgi:hypothetical protein
MTTNQTVTAEEFKAAQDVMRAKYREDRRNSRYEGKVWFSKEKDKYGRVVRYIKKCVDGELSTVGVVVLVPRWNKDLPMKKFFTNDWTVPGTGPDALKEHDKLAEALARFNCGTVEGELY